MSAEASDLVGTLRAELDALKAELKRLRREVGRGVAMACVQADPDPADDVPMPTRETPGILQSIIIPALVSDRTRTAQIVDDVVRAIRRGRNCLVMAGRTEHVDLLAAEITSRGLAPMVLHGSVSPGQRRAILRQLADWDPARTREPLLLAATAS